MTSLHHRLPALALALLLSTSANAADTFRVVTFNLNNYFLDANGSRPMKSPESQAQVHQSILALKPDVLAMQEMSAKGLKPLQAALKAGGLDLPHSEIITGWDTNIHVAVLSRFPITARRPHTNDSFLVQGRRLHVSRGFLEVDIAVNDRYRFTLITAHLKSKRPVPEADEAEMRHQEALLLREKIDARFRANPDVNLVVLGDFNDTKDTPPIKALKGRGKTALVDTRPAERNGDNLPAERPTYDPRNVTWTYHYGVEDSYSRVDYLMISPGFAKEWVKDETYVLMIPNWGLASDHRPLVATFTAAD